MRARKVVLESSEPNVWRQSTYIDGKLVSQSDPAGLPLFKTIHQAIEGIRLGNIEMNRRNKKKEGV